jgi:TusA-related sulfurtransferase
MLSLIKTDSPTIYRQIEQFIQEENEKLLYAKSDLEKILIKHKIADAKLFLTGLRLAKSGA